jgi:hypothetical protein
MPNAGGGNTSQIIGLDQLCCLEALATLDQQWTSILEAAAKGDEDTAADYGNDALQLGIVQERIEAAAVAEYGPTIKDFSRDPITVDSSPAANGEHQPRPANMDRPPEAAREPFRERWRWRRHGECTNASSR